jgi:hypothetical protein
MLLDDRRMRRVLRVFWWLANAAALPFSALAMLFLLNLVNPMAGLFVTQTTIENRTHLPLHVTPVGWHESGTPASRRYTLPIFASESPALAAWQESRFAVAAGRSLRLLWDCDDFRWSELIVETPDGRLLQQPVEDCSDRVVILDVEALAPAAPHVAIALGPGLSRHQWLMLLMPAGVLVNLAGLVGRIRAARRESTEG